MNKFDFSEPIISTIIFEDNPYDTTISDVQEKSLERTVFSTCSTPCVSKSNKHLQCLPIIDFDAPTRINTNNEICNVTETTQLSYIDNNYNQDQITHMTVTNMENFNYNNFYQYNTQKHLNNSNSPSVNETLPLNYMNNSTLNKDKFVDNRFSSHINNLLNAVSENILAILRAYRSYVKIQSNRECTKAELDNSRNYFLRIKRHYFTQSYSILMVLFLPEHKIGNFDKRFLENTFNIAASKNFYCTYNELERLYTEMMNWLLVSKQKPNDLLLHYIYEPKNRQEQRKPKNSNQKNSMSSQKRPTPPPYRDPKLQNVFLSGPPGREVQIHVNQDFLQNCINASNTETSTNLTQIDPNMDVTSLSVNPSNVNNYNRLTIHNNQLNNTASIQNNSSITAVSGMLSWPLTNCLNQRVPEHLNIQITDVRTERPIQTRPPEYRRKSTTDQANIRSSDSRDSGFISPVNFNFTTEQMVNYRFNLLKN